jgi:hypothetical protein
VAWLEGACAFLCRVWEALRACVACARAPSAAAARAPAQSSSVCAEAGITQAALFLLNLELRSHGFLFAFSLHPSLSRHTQRKQARRVAAAKSSKRAPAPTKKANKGKLKPRRAKAQLGAALK